MNTVFRSDSLSPEILSKQLRIDSLRATTEAGSGHPTSALSASDLMAVLISEHLRLDVADLKNPDNDHLILSKGHAAPLLYAALKALDIISDEEMLSLRQEGSRLEGHPTPQIPLVDAATGSLGQGLGIGAGIALAAKSLEHRSFRTWVILGDGEMAEGSVWEALAFSAYHKLSNLIAIVDINRLGQTGETELGWDIDTYAQRISAFGWNALPIDGHDHAAISKAFNTAREASESPTAILAQTVKGRGVPDVEDSPDYHGKAFSFQHLQDFLNGNRLEADFKVLPKTPINSSELGNAELRGQRETPILDIDFEGTVSTRSAYGRAIESLGTYLKEVVVLDAEVSDSTKSSYFMKRFPERAFEMFIAEQNMVATAVGIQSRGYKVFLSTFAAFLSRAADFFRMAAISEADLRVVGSHCGVSIGQDGPSQMGLEDLAMFLPIFGSTIFYPCDPYQTTRLVECMSTQSGISYLRTTREDTPVIYTADEQFPRGGSKTLLSSNRDYVTILTAGITVHEALSAAEVLKQEGVDVRVMDMYSVKPIDSHALLAAAQATEGRFLVVEDHRPEGGLASVVAQTLCSHRAQGAESFPFPSITHLAVRGMPGSAKPHEQLSAASIDRRSIVEAVREMNRSGQKDKV